LNEEPTQPELNNHLKLLLGQAMDDERDKVLVHRKNCYIHLSRQGTVSISWPISGGDSSSHLNLQTWPKLFQGAYLSIAMKALAESGVLLELGNLSAGKADMLRRAISFHEMEQSRLQLRELAALMVRYMMSMNHHDSGESSELVQFFSYMRHVLGVPSAKQEIREQIDDVLGIVQAQYMEEQKKIKRREVTERMEQLIRKKRAAMNKESKRRWFEIGIAAVTTLTLPSLIVASLFGMNVPGIPQYAWWNLVGATIGITGVLLIVVMVICWCYFVDKSKTKRALQKVVPCWKNQRPSTVSVDSNAWGSSRYSTEFRERRSHCMPTVSMDLQQMEEGSQRSFSVDGVRRKSMMWVLESEN